MSPGPPVSSTNKTYLHEITEILFKVALSTIKQTKNIFVMPYLQSWLNSHVGVVAGILVAVVVPAIVVTVLVYIRRKG